MEDLYSNTHLGSLVRTGGPVLLEGWQMAGPARALHPHHGLSPDPSLAQAGTALLIVDMQYLDAHPLYGTTARLKAQGLHESYTYYTERLKVIVRNIQRLLAGFRTRRMEVIYSAIESLTQNGRDRSLEHKRLGLFAPPGSKESKILRNLAPGQDEIVLKKTCGSVFNGTIIHHVLCNLGIRTLVVCGVVTSGCVESTVRDASNLSYEVLVVEDACAAYSRETHESAIYIMGVYAKIFTTDELIAKLDATVPRAHVRHGPTV